MNFDEIRYSHEINLTEGINEFRFDWHGRKLYKEIFLYETKTSIQPAGLFLA